MTISTPIFSFLNQVAVETCRCLMYLTITFYGPLKSHPFIWPLEELRNSLQSNIIAEVEIKFRLHKFGKIKAVSLQYVEVTSGQGTLSQQYPDSELSLVGPYVLMQQEPVART